MHDSFLVQLTNGDDNLSSIELDLGLRESLVLLKDLVQLSSIDEWHDKVQSRLRLEKIIHTAQEWMVSLKQNVLLEGHACHLVILDQHILSDGLDGIFLLSVWQ